MGQAAVRIHRRKQAKKQLADLFNRADQAIIIHYSCESFYDRPDGSSPRITSIAVRNLATGQTDSFSIHQMAEQKGVPSVNLEQEYNHLERLMLEDFYRYVYTHSNNFWLHWNMRDINYGFQALAHRYKVLGANPVAIHESKLIDLSRLLLAIYGDHYIGHPRLHKLFEKNQLTHTSLLSGAEEAKAFERKEYVKLHQSTLRKVDTFETVAERANTGSLKTESAWHYAIADYPEFLGDFLKEHWVVSIISFISAIAGIAALFIS